MLICDSPPLEHFDYDELEDENSQCGCVLCTAYRDSLAEFTYYSAICSRHKRTCKCTYCKERNSSQIVHMAALNKRDTYSELSFVVNRRMDESAHTHLVGTQFLQWIYNRMIDKAWKTEGWWAIQASNFTLQDWIEQWQLAYLPRALWEVSGIYCAMPDTDPPSEAITLP